MNYEWEFFQVCFFGFGHVGSVQCRIDTREIGFSYKPVNKKGIFYILKKILMYLFVKGCWKSCHIFWYAVPYGLEILLWYHRPKEVEILFYHRPSCLLYLPCTWFHADYTYVIGANIKFVAVITSFFGFYNIANPTAEWSGLDFDEIANRTACHSWV